MTQPPGRHLPSTACARAGEPGTSSRTQRIPWCRRARSIATINRVQGRASSRRQIEPVFARGRDATAVDPDVRRFDRVERQLDRTGGRHLELAAHHGGRDARIRPRSAIPREEAAPPRWCRPAANSDRLLGTKAPAGPLCECRATLRMSPPGSASGAARARCRRHRARSCPAPRGTGPGRPARGGSGPRSGPPA